MFEQSKAASRRYRDGAFIGRYFVGDGIDLGGEMDPLIRMSNAFPLMRSCRTWNATEGDIQTMPNVPAESFDFVHASHCLACTSNVHEALDNWCRILKPGGYLIVTVPDEDTYERGTWPSRFNPSHKWSFTLRKSDAVHYNSVNVIDLVQQHSDTLCLERLWRVSDFFNDALPKDLDQSRLPNVECAIEIVWRKRGSWEPSADMPHIHSSLTASAPGVWTRPGISNFSRQVGDHYRNEAIAILIQDREHYAQLRERLQHLDPDLLAGRQRTFAIGGGHPKFEAMFTTGSITVLDQFADEYRAQHGEFKSRYPLRCGVEYRTSRLDPSDLEIPEDATTTFIHFLEHQTPEEIDAWFAHSSREVIVYGPSIEAARGEDWFHFATKDHITFLTLDAMKSTLERQRYSVVNAFRFHENYYIRARR